MPEPSASRIVEQYSGVPAAEVAKREGVLIGYVLEARRAYGVDPDDGTDAGSLANLMRDNRAPFL